MEPVELVACVSGFNDAGLLAGCLGSLAGLVDRVVYGDGAYRLFPHAERWWSNADVYEAVSGCGIEVKVVPAPPEAPWESEAAKKTAIAAAVPTSADWTLWLDTDERAETPSGAAALRSRLASSTAIDWGYVNIWRPEHRHHPAGFWLPRLIRHGGIEFRPPRDFEVYKAGERIAYLDGEAVPASAMFAHIPTTLLRLRHDRHLRSVARLDANAVYQINRRIAHGTD